MDEWYRLARSEWANLSGTELKHKRPHFKWRSAAGPTSKAGETASALTATWRQLARRGADCAATLDGSLKSTAAQCKAVEDHYRAIRRTSYNMPKGVPPEARQMISNWVRHFDAAYIQQAPRIIRSLVKLADTKATQLENAARNARAQGWRDALGNRNATSASRTPTKLAYRWLKGICGWIASPLGKQAQNDDVPQETDDQDSDDEAEHDDLEHVTG